MEAWCRRARVPQTHRGDTIVRFLIAALFIGHGLVHGIMFALPYSAQARADLPFNPGRSWLIGEARGLGLGLAVVVTAAFLVAGGGYLSNAAWWPEVTLIAAALSIALLLLYFSRWWIAGLAISVVLTAAAVWALVQP